MTNELSNAQKACLDQILDDFAVTFNMKHGFYSDYIVRSLISYLTEYHSGYDLEGSAAILADAARGLLAREGSVFEIDRAVVILRNGNIIMKEEGVRAKDWPGIAPK